MPVADGMVFVSPHPGQGQILLKCIDPSVADERDALSVVPALDFLDPANGFRDGPEGSRYSEAFVQTFRQAQSERVRRLDDLARAMIGERLSARKLAKTSGSAADRRKGAHTSVMTIWRTDADLRCWDPTIDPSDRKSPACYRGHPAVANRTPSIGRANTLKTWLSMWSLETSKCQGAEQLAKFDTPALVVQGLADTGVFPSDAHKIFNNIASKDKTLELVPGAHYFEDSEQERVNAASLMCDWVASRL